MEHVVELVRFTLREGSNVDEFVQAAEKNLEDLRKQPGFCYRSLSCDSESGMWSDISYWSSLENAKASSDKFMQWASAQKMVSFINSDSLKMDYEYVKMTSQTAV